MTLGPYARAARLYRAQGWQGTLPVVGKCEHIPPQFTGHNGGWPSDQQVATWIGTRGGNNIVLRLPQNVIGIDVDAYDGRHGLETLTKFESDFGTLPVTHIITSRVDGSGIRLFQVPPDVQWVADLGTNSDVQICRYAHRYVVTWPSIHPLTNREYKIWYNGETIESLVRPEELARLPQTWIDGLTKRTLSPFWEAITDVLGDSSSGSDAVSRGTGTVSRGTGTVSRGTEHSLTDSFTGNTSLGDVHNTASTQQLADSSRVDPELMLLIGAPPGEQDERLYRYLCSLRTRKISAAEAFSLGVLAIGRMHESRPEDPWTPEHVRDKVERIWRDYHPGTTIEKMFGGSDGNVPRISNVQQEWADAAQPLVAPTTLSAGPNDIHSAGEVIDRDTLLRRRNSSGANNSEGNNDDPGRNEFGTEHLTDTGNADRFARMYADKRLRYVSETGEWHVWNGNRWTRDVHGEASHLTRYVADDVRREGQRLSRNAADDQRPLILKTYGNWAQTSESAPRRKALLDIAGTHPLFLVSRTELDRDPRLLVCENGVIELLDTGWKFRPGRPDDTVMLNTGVEFDKKARSSDWDRFVSYVQPLTGLRKHLQAIDGYSLYGANPLRLWVILFGQTSTGKTTYLELIGDTLGDYASAANMSLFRDNQDERPRADIVDALTRRRIHMSEAEIEKYLHVDQIKRMTGMEKISARLPHSRMLVEQVPCFTPFLASNNVPTVEGADEALLSRLHVIPFNADRMEQSSGILGVVSRLRRDPPRAAILNYLLAGWNMYACDDELNNNLPELDTAKLDVADQFNSFGDFIDEYCDRDPVYSDTAERLLLAYVCWQKEHHFTEKITSKSFASKLLRQGLTSQKRQRVTCLDGVVRQKTTWRGVKVRAEYENAVHERFALGRW